MASCRPSRASTACSATSRPDWSSITSGLAQNLKNALSQYSKSDQAKTGVDEREAVAVMLEKYEVVRDIFHGFDYLTRIQGKRRKSA